MASAKRKQDEKNLKTLRELVAQPGNKECFDCRQRGPTYANMTIGSFVCTTCSGILRGLTPPHRVKSISMATFSQNDISFLREHGNEHCRRIWLGLLSPENQLNVDTKDEQKLKDLLIQKYEFKRYYLDPSLSNDNANQKNANSKIQTSKSNTNPSQTKASIPRVPNPAAFTPAPVQNKTKTETAPTFVPDFVADFSKIQDPFSVTSPNKNSAPILPQPSFANFDNNPIFNNTKNTESLQLDNKSRSLSSNLNGVNAPPPEDRYAALKDLDSLMKQAQLKEENSVPKSTWNSNNSNAPNLNWSMNNMTGQMISNPFASNDLWRPSVNIVNNNMQPIDNSFCTNPFRPAHFTMTNDSMWSGRESQNNEDVISSSQLMTSLSGKTWQPSVTSYHANPFMVGSGVSDISRNSNNPFL